MTEAMTTQLTGSRSQDAFMQELSAMREQRAAEGLYKPYTIINFNDDVSLTLEGQLNKYKVPSPTDEHLAPGVSQVEMIYDGKPRIGQALVIRWPEYYGKLKSAAPIRLGMMADPVVDRDVAFYDPIAIAYAFLEHYSPIFVTPGDGRLATPPKDQRPMCGVMAFEGDLHAIAPHNLKANGGVIRVPLARVLKTGIAQRRIYEAVSFSLEDYKRMMFDGQKRFALQAITMANRFWGGDQNEKNKINEFHRIRMRWAIRYGYAQPPSPDKPHWFDESTVTAAPEEGSAEGLRTCQNCNAVEPRPDTPFCPSCNAPVDIFQTFMGDAERGILGRPVPEAWLQTLVGEERELVLEEMARRREGFEMQPSVVSGQLSAAKPRGAYKGKTGAKPAEEAAAE